MELIGESSFEGCNNLTLIDIVIDINAIDKYAFKNAENLRKVKITSPDGAAAAAYFKAFSKLLFVIHFAVELIPLKRLQSTIILLRLIYRLSNILKAPLSKIVKL